MEIKNFRKVANSFTKAQLNNYKYGTINSIFPNFLVVFAFAILEVIIDLPLLSINILNPVINKSRKIIRPTIQNSITFKTAKDIKAEETKILSANGSKNFPSGVI